MANDRPVTSPEDLFIRRFDQIQALLNNAPPSPLDCVDIAAALAKLISDKTCLMDAANTTRMKLRFVARQLQPMAPHLPKPAFRASLEAVDPMSEPNAPAPLTLTKDGFLGLKVMEAEGVEIRVRDLIRYARNVEGGTHFDPGKVTGEWAKIRAFSRIVAVYGAPIGFHQLVPVARVALRGMTPLYEACKAEGNR